MTSALLSIALVLTPAPYTTPKEPTWPSVMTTNAPDVDAPSLSTSFWVDESLLMLVGSPPIVLSAPTATPPPPDPPPVLSPIEVGMNRLAELGATGWQLRTFGCLAWYESRNDPYAVSPTRDYGLWQINRYFHAWRWAGRDIFDPIVNAGIAWDIYRESGWRAWTTARLCGV